MESFQQIGQCTVQTWSPGIGDPTIWGWLTVGLYALAAVVAGLTVKKSPFPQRTMGREQFFWVCLTVMLAFLAINKQLDLQTLATDFARCAATIQGWYEDRRALQVAVILGLGTFTILFGIAFLVFLRGTMRRTFLPMLGAAFVTGFVLIRAVGFHHMDGLINSSLPIGFGTVKVNFLFETPGPLLIMLSGLWLLRKSDG